MNNWPSLTFGQLVKVDVEAQHDGPGDEAKGRADGGQGEEDAWKTQPRTNLRGIKGSELFPLFFFYMF